MNKGFDATLAVLPSRKLSVSSKLKFAYGLGVCSAVSRSKNFAASAWAKSLSSAAPTKKRRFGLDI
jgi:hypothetical protein